MRTVLWVGGSALASAILTFVVIVGYWWTESPSAARRRGEDPEGLEVAAALTWGMVAAVLAGVSVGLLAFAIAWWRASDRGNAPGTP